MEQRGQNIPQKPVEQKNDIFETQKDTSLRIMLTFLFILFVFAGIYFSVKHLSESSQQDIQQDISFVTSSEDNTVLPLDMLLKESKEEGVQFDRWFIEGADPESMEIIGDYYTRDKQHVYFGGEQVTEADRATFCHIGGVLAKDKNNIYCFGKVFSGVDSSTFEYVGGSFSKDKNSAYMYTYIMRDVDLETFEYLGSSYTRDANKIYLADKVISEADYNSFEFVGSLYAKDKNNVYYVGPPYIIAEADPESFVYLGEGYLGEGYAKDDNSYYYMNKRTDNLDSGFLSTLNKEFLFKEAGLVNFEYFEKLGDYYIQVDDRVLYLVRDESGRGVLKEIKEADVKTFTYSFLGWSDGYATDKNHVYFEGNILPLVDSKTFEIVPFFQKEGSYFIKDKDRVYSQHGEIIKGIKPMNCTEDNFEGCGMSVNSPVYINPVYGYSFSYTGDMQLVATGHIPSDLTSKGIVSMEDLNMSDGDSLLIIDLESGDNIIYTISELSSKNGYTTFDDYIDMFLENLNKSNFVYTTSESIVGEGVVSTEVFFKTEADAHTGVFYDNVFEAGEKAYSISFGYPENAENADDLLTKYRDLLSSFKVGDN
ncbi:MAG: DKNYY domain-containing protein [Candidatus Pacebacteria bacterium]|nr:DKNYY domain-containing protein [Candidatus Paceibacterota bacterium]